MPIPTLKTDADTLRDIVESRGIVWLLNELVREADRRVNDATWTAIDAERAAWLAVGNELQETRDLARSSGI